MPYIILFIFSFIFVSQALGKKIDGIIATINNEPILMSDRFELEKTIQNDSILDNLPLGTTSAEALKKDPKARLNYLVRSKMLDSEVKRLRLEVTIERLEQELRNIARSNNITREELPQALKEQGLNFSDYQTYLKKRIERQAFVEQEISSKIKVSEEDLLAAYYARFKKTPQASFEVELAQIFFSSKKGGNSAAKSRAEGVMSRLASGDSFNTLVTQFSEDSQVQKNGYLGKFTKSELDARLAKAIEKQKDLGLINEVVLTPAGAHIFNIISRKIIFDNDYLSKKENLREVLLSQQMSHAIEQWFEQKKSQFSIQIFTE